MALTINTNITAIRTQNVYNKNNTAMNAAMTRVATAQKINSAKDNASVWAISEKMREQIRANEQANQNVQNDSALVRTAQDGMGNTLSILTTLKERAINSANDTNVSGDRTKIVEEVRQLVAQVDDNAAKVKFNGRQLLNGGQEGGTVSKTSASSAVGVTATEPTGNAAVYGITGLSKWDSANNKYVDATGSDTFKTLLDANGNGGRLFQEGDVITVSWLNNGEAKQASITVGDTTALSELVTAITYADKNLDATDTGIKTDNASFTNAVNADNQTLSISEGGLYIVGSQGRTITDVSVSVRNSAGMANTRAEEILQPTPIQQASGASATAGSNYGSNAVIQAVIRRDTTGSVEGNVIGDDGDKTAWMNLKNSTPDASEVKDGKDYIYDTRVNGGSTAATTEFKFTVDGKSVTLLGRETIEDLNQKFKDAGINVRAHIATAANEELTYDGQTVISGDSKSSTSYKVTAAGLYFVSAQGETVNNIKIEGGTTSGGKAGISGNVTIDIDNFDSVKPQEGYFERVLKVDSSWIDGSSSSGAAGGSSLLPQGQELQFFVGGEANFGINFSIGKATVANLFGTSADAFANKFATKEGAESALVIIDNAINKVLTEQTRLGAMEARLGYTSDNIVSMNENLEAGYSAYRDADLAKEMTSYMKYAVLSQASQYMLAQAGQNGFQALNLLQQ